MNALRPLCLILFSAMLSAQPIPASSPTPFTPGNYTDNRSKEIERVFRAHLEFLGGDVCEGRAPGSRGEMVAIQYIVSQMKLLGLKPGVGDSYVQPVPIIGISTGRSAALEARGSNGTGSFRFLDEFVAFPGITRPEVAIDADVVFVGYGIVAPKERWDDFKGVDVKGKVLLILNDDPNTDDPDFFAGKGRTYYGRWTYKFEEAARRGAAGAIIIHTTPSAGYPWQVVQSSWSRERYTLPPVPGVPQLPMNSWLTFDAAKNLTGLGGHTLEKLIGVAQSRDFQPVPLGVRVRSLLKNTIRPIESANVVGILPGSDPTLRNQHIIYTAHHDHFGIGRPIKGDSIYNGALDNAAGVATMLAAASEFVHTTPQPKRSIIFCTVTGEEFGLIGSQYYCEHPTVPASALTANINIEGAGILGPSSDVVQIGMGHSSIDDDVKAVAGNLRLIVKPDPEPDKGSFFRSDQFNFVKIGVPAAYVGSGRDIVGKPAEWGKEMEDSYVAETYHQPTDEIKPWWNFAGAVQTVQFQYLLGLRLANADAPPTWKSGTEFGSVRTQTK